MFWNKKKEEEVKRREYRIFEHYGKVAIESDSDRIMQIIEVAEKRQKEIEKKVDLILNHLDVQYVPEKTELPKLEKKTISLSDVSYTTVSTGKLT